MSRITVRAYAVLLVALASPIAAQEAPPAPLKMTGTWEFTIDAPQGPDVMKITIEQVADTLKGTAESQFGTLPLSKGRINGRDITFALLMTMPGGGEGVELSFKGTFTGDTGTGSIGAPMMEGQVMSWRAKRLAK